MNRVYETWAERDLDRYLERYDEGAEETEKRMRECALCGAEFDREEGKLIETKNTSPIRIRGKRPKCIYICDSCIEEIYEIREEDDYEY